MGIHDGYPWTGYIGVLQGLRTPGGPLGSQVDISDHAPGVDDPGLGAREHAMPLQFLEIPRHHPKGRMDEPGERRHRHGPVWGGEVAVGHAVVHEPQHLGPETTSSQRTGLQRRVSSPITGVELEGRRLHSVLPYARRAVR